MSPKRLYSRGIVDVSGEDGCLFLQGLLTNDVETMEPDSAAFGTLLTPQGKILFDFIVYRRGNAYLFDLPAAAAAPFAKRLTLYKLRSKVKISNVSDDLAVLVDSKDADAPLDPRHDDLGGRRIVSIEDAPEADGTTEFDERRIALGIAECWTDYASGDVFPHEANIDQLGGVNFSKGCYVGQEVVSRMQHRGLARKRFLPARVEGPPPAMGTEVLFDGRNVGTAGSSSGDYCLALLRLDRITAALDGLAPLNCGDSQLFPAYPPWMPEKAVSKKETGE